MTEMKKMTRQIIFERLGTQKDFLRKGKHTATKRSKVKATKTQMAVSEVV